ncbi:hypothetical protein CY652_16930 [Burkholderia sp. WAC0059]|uniref:hypothetical protein n=1 Tax=Burkholderia sp. WAC0059 TaxID=2066022 RepID=UPI000C7F29D6|nr:hypothetical protein [Burkholderia sp. WAC0059]PLZ01231.1 hypothetical protein CY652_16930 [Burkholderia sp. WAC0059]
MGSAQQLPCPDAFDAGFVTKTSSRPNIVALRPTRALFEVILDGGTAARSLEDLATLQYSPIGVYISWTEVRREKVFVQFDIAPEDFDFMLHALLSTLPEATIGPVRRRSAANNVHGPNG